MWFPRQGAGRVQENVSVTHGLQESEDGAKPRHAGSSLKVGSLFGVLCTLYKGCRTILGT